VKGGRKSKKKRNLEGRKKKKKRFTRAQKGIAIGESE